MFACVFTQCMCVWMCVHMCIKCYVHTCVNVCVCSHMCECLCVCTYVRVYTCACAVCICVCECCLCVHMCEHVKAQADAENHHASITVLFFPLSQDISIKELTCSHCVLLVTSLASQVVWRALPLHF